METLFLISIASFNSSCFGFPEHFFMCSGNVFLLDCLFLLPPSVCFLFPFQLSQVFILHPHWPPPRWPPPHLPEFLHVGRFLYLEEIVFEDQAPLSCPVGISNTRPSIWTWSNSTWLIKLCWEYGNYRNATGLIHDCHTSASKLPD